MEIGIVGLPNVGKSTLFNALTRLAAPAENYPFCTIEPNVGIVTVPDKRLERLAEIVHPKQVTPATVRFVDIAGLVAGAHKGEGLGNQFLSHIRNVDAILHIVRCFQDNQIIHVSSSIDPVRDADTIETELLLADLSTVEKRHQAIGKRAQTDPEARPQAAALERLLKEMSDGRMARQIGFETDDDRALVASLQLLTQKPILYGANLSEADIKNHDAILAPLRARAKERGYAVLPIAAKFEHELNQLEGEEKQMFLSEYGLDAGGLGRMIRSCYELLGLITFFTAGEKEARAWTVTRGATAPEAAGKIHSDIQAGFVKAEIVSYDELDKAGTYAKIREAGRMRTEGREYVIQDGDVCYFKFTPKGSGQ